MKVSEVVLTCVDTRYVQAPDGQIYNDPPNLPPDFFQKFRDVWPHVKVVARLREVDNPPHGLKPVDVEGVEFIKLPDYHGLIGAVLKFQEVQRIVRHAADPDMSIVLRSGGLAVLVEQALLSNGHPYGLEVVADVYDFFGPGSYRSIAQPLLRQYFLRTLRRQCWNATATSYVTQHALQRRYRPHPKAFTTYYSDIILKDESVVEAPRSHFDTSQGLRLIFVGTLEQLYKGPDVLIESLAICIKNGLNLQLVIVGDGRYRSDLMTLAQAHGLADRIEFLGNLPSGSAISAQLDLADLFVLPSYQEGVPKAMIEAMGRALPCIGSTVGGIPELLPSEDLVPPGNAAALAEKLHEIVADPQRMSRMSARNLVKARDYTDAVLRSRRNALYRFVRDRTEEWLNHISSRLEGAS